MAYKFAACKATVSRIKIPYTCFNQISHFFQGRITIDGYDIKDLNPIWLRNHIGTVTQEPILFSSTIRENIAYGAENPDLVTNEEIGKSDFLFKILPLDVVFKKNYRKRASINRSWFLTAKYGV